MKALYKALGALVLVLVLTFAASAKAAAFSEENFASLEFTDAKGFRTLITDTSGGHWSRSGALDPAALEFSGCVEDIASYELLYCGETVMSVTLHDLQSPPPQGTSSAVGALNGYYTAEFNMDSSREAFITGLTSRNLLQVQTELINAKLEYRYFNITNIDFIDTEKTGSSDSMLCWAASCADILQYTGWGSAAGFSDADDIFEAYIRAFDDVGGNAYYGWQWFFSGYNAKQEVSGWAHIDDGTYSTFKGWLPAYSPENVTTLYDVKHDWSPIDDTFASLREGGGVSILLGWYGDYGRNGGHAISLWGYVLNNAASGKDKYEALIISDSDSDIYSADRRDAPNKYRLLEMEPYSGNNMDSFKLDYSNYSSGVLENFVILHPCSGGIQKDSGTRDKFNNFDLVVDTVDVALIGANGKGGSIKVAPVGEDVWIQPLIWNCSGRNADNIDFQYTVTVTDSSGTKMYEETRLFYDMTIIAGNDFYAEKVNIGKYEPGRYTVTVAVYAGEAEAYISNNSGSVSFSVAQKPEGADGVSLEAEVKNRTHAFLSITGLDNILGFTPTRYDVYEVYEQTYENGTTIQFCNFIGTYNSLPESVTMPLEKPTVALAVVVQPAESGVPSLALISDYISVETAELGVFAVSGWQPYTGLQKDEKALKPGEEFAFTVNNNSGKTLNYTAKVVAVRRYDSWQVDLYSSEELGLDAGEVENFSISSWTVGGLFGDFDIYAVAEGSWGKAEYQLGSLSFVAETEYINQRVEFSGLSARFSFNASMQLDYYIYLSAEFTEDKNATLTYEDSVYVDMATDQSSGLMSCVSGQTTPLKPDTVYYWRPVLSTREYGEDGSYKDVEICGDWVEFATPGLDELTQLALNTAETVELGEKNEYAYYAFTAPESGTYTLNLSADFGENAEYISWSLYRWDTNIHFWLNEYCNTDTYSMDMSLGQNEKAYFAVKCYSGCKVSVNLVQTGEYVEDFKTLSLSNVAAITPFEITGTISIDAPSGSSFILYILDEESGIYNQIQKFTNFAGGTASAEFSINAIPGKTCVISPCWSPLGDDYFTMHTGDKLTVEVPPYLGAQLGLETTAVLRIGKDGISGYQAFTAPKAANYLAKVSGKSGWTYLSLMYFTSSDGMPEHVPILNSDQVLSVHLNEGESVYFRASGGEGDCVTLEVYDKGASVKETTPYDTETGITLSSYWPDESEEYILGVEYGEPGGKTYTEETRLTGGQEVYVIRVHTRPSSSYSCRAYVQALDGEKRYYSVSSSFSTGSCSATSLNLGSNQYSCTELSLYAFSSDEPAWYTFDVAPTSGHYRIWNEESGRWSDNIAQNRKTLYMKSGETEYIWADSGSGSISVSKAAAQTTFSITSASAVTNGAFEQVKVSAAIPYGSDFSLGVAYGADEDTLNYRWLKYENYPSETIEADVALPMQPGEEYVYRAVLLDRANGTYYYGDWGSFTGAETCYSPELTPGEFGTSENGSFTFTAAEAGLYTLSATGEKGELWVWKVGDELWQSCPFDEDRRAFSFTLVEGESVYIWQEGLESLMLTGGYASAVRSGDGVTVSFMPEKTGTYIATAYDADGRMLECKVFTMESLTGEEQTIGGKFTVRDASIVRVFSLANNMPQRAAITTAIPKTA